MRIKGNLFIACMILLLQGICFQGFAQPPAEKDSLLRVLASLPGDTAKVRTYSLLSEWYTATRTQFKLARNYADSTHFLAEKLNFKEGIALASFNYGIINKHEGNFTEALEQLGEFVQFYSARGDSLLVAKGVYQQGIVHSNMADYEKSLPLYLRAQAIYEKFNKQEQQANVLNSIGNIYRRTQRVRESIPIYKQANAIFQKLDLQKEYAMGLQGLGNTYGVLKSYDTARYYYEESLRLIEKLGHEPEMAIVLGNLGVLHAKFFEYEKALPYHQRALAIWRKLPQRRSLANSLNNIGQSYLKLNKLDLAEKYFNEGLQLARELKAKDLLHSFYGEIHELYVARKDFERAYHFYTLSNQMKDSIYNEENARQINELQTKYETAKKDQQITLLAKEKEIQAKEAQRQSTLKKASIGGILLVSLLAGLIFYISRQKLKNQKLLIAKDNEIKEVNYKRQMTELEMKALQAQINPHFLFNCMNSINRMILEGDNENASVYLSKFSKLVRLILENAESTKVTLQSELTLLESYIQLEALRFKGKIDYKIKVDASIDPDDTYLPSMVLQPFVENAIWHGLMHKNGESEKGVIEVSIKEENNRLYCIIEDNGVGREKARELQQQSVLKKTSLGMKITEERLRLLSKEQVEQLVRITDLKDAFNHALGTRVEINIPVS